MLFAAEGLLPVFFPNILFYAPMLGDFFHSSTAAAAWNQTCLAVELLGLSASLNHRITEYLGWRAP